MDRPLLRLNHRSIKGKMIYGEGYQNHTLHKGERRVIHILLSGTALNRNGELLVGAADSKQPNGFWWEADSNKFLQPYPEGEIPWSIAYG